MCHYVVWAFFVSLALSPGRLSSLQINHFCIWALYKQYRWRGSTAESQKCRSTLPESAQVSSHLPVQSWLYIVMQLMWRRLIVSRPGHTPSCRDRACTAPASSCWRFLDVSTIYITRSNALRWDLHNSKEDVVTHPLVLKHYRQTMKAELGSNGGYKYKCPASVIVSLGLHKDNRRRQGRFESRKWTKTLNLSSMMSNRRKCTSERCGKATLDRRKKEKGMEVIGNLKLVTDAGLWNRTVHLSKDTSQEEIKPRKDIIFNVQCI